MRYQSYVSSSTPRFGSPQWFPARHSPARDRFGCKSSGRRRFQPPSKHVAERLWRPAAKALDVAGWTPRREQHSARAGRRDARARHRPCSGSARRRRTRGEAARRGARHLRAAATTGLCGASQRWSRSARRTSVPRDRKEAPGAAPGLVDSTRSEKRRFRRHPDARRSPPRVTGAQVEVRSPNRRKEVEALYQLRTSRSLGAILMAFDTRTWCSSPRSQRRYTVALLTRSRRATSRTENRAGEQSRARLVGGSESRCSSCPCAKIANGVVLNPCSKNAANFCRTQAKPSQAQPIACSSISEGEVTDGSNAIWRVSYAGQVRNALRQEFST